MNSISHHSTTLSQAEIQTLEKQVVLKLRKSIDNIVKDIARALNDSYKMDITHFVKVHISNKKEPLSLLDKRSKQFANRILAVADEKLNEMDSMIEALTLLEVYSKETSIRKKLLARIAYPVVVKLIKDLDSINPALVNGINVYYDVKYPSCTARVVKFFKIKRLFEGFSWISCSWEKVSLIALGAIIASTYLSGTPKSVDQQSPDHILIGFKEFLGNLTFQQGFKVNLGMTFDSSYNASIDWNAINIIEKTQGMDTPYNHQNALQAINDFFGFIQKFKDQKCLFRVSSNLTFANDLMNFIFESSIKAKC